MAKIGDVKYVKKFAFIPKIVDNTIIWLKPYYQKYVYVRSRFIAGTDVQDWRETNEKIRSRT